MDLENIHENENVSEEETNQTNDSNTQEEEKAPPVGSDYKTKQGFFNKLAGKFFRKEEAPDDGGSDDGGSDDGGEDVPDDGVFEITDEIKEAAKAAGWDDERVQKYAEENPDALRLLALQHKSEPTYLAEDPSVKENDKKDSPKLDKLELSSKALDEMREQYGDEVVNDVISPLIDKLNKVVEVLDAQAAQSQAAQQAVNNVVIAEREKNFQQKLDMLDEQLPVFGKWENVPRDRTGQIDVKSPQFKARAEVWVTAQSLEKAGFDWDTSLDNAIALYKGKHLESVVKSQVIKDLNGRKKQFTAQPTHKKTKPVKLEGKQAAIQAVKDAAQQAGVTF